MYLFLFVFVCGVACVWMSAEVWEPIFSFCHVGPRVTIQVIRQMTLSTEPSGQP